jgi:hypothetical protein
MHALKSIMLATDFHPASLNATQVAVDLAAACNARLTLFHVFQSYDLTAVDRHSEAYDRLWQRERAEVCRHRSDKVRPLAVPTAPTS